MIIETRANTISNSTTDSLLKLNKNSTCKPFNRILTKVVSKHVRIVNYFFEHLGKILTFFAFGPCVVYK